MSIQKTALSLAFLIAFSLPAALAETPVTTENPPAMESPHAADETPFPETTNAPNPDEGTAENSLGLEEEPGQAASADHDNLYLFVKTRDLDRQPFPLQAFSGKPTLINIWSTSCDSCLDQLESLQKISQHYEGRLQVLGLLAEAAMVDASGRLILQEDKISLAKELMQSKGITFPVITPDDSLMALLYYTQLKTYPTTWLVDSHGRIRQILDSSQDEQAWYQYLDEALTLLAREENPR